MLHNEFSKIILVSERIGNGPALVRAACPAACPACRAPLGSVDISLTPTPDYRSP